MLPLLLALALQTTPVAPIVKGTALPPPASEEAEVLAPITALFAAITTRDATTVEPLLLPGGAAIIATEKPDGSRSITRTPWPQLLARFTPGAERLEERMRSPAIEIDGDIAMVWGDYVFLIDGKVHHCGVDHFDMVRENGAWKIANVSWTSRTTGCPAQ
ncbi:nuclear transport factor 2 family protein [Sphingomonas hengshuiensis]|uniref:DUF4440 domain-containing protein n=1 Tax=Sphingomonas hengshuiensis TaxID=1609977 RepID=A0A7U4LEJ6_9SPHN|nr:nuclear transport factor 2 family protein [Sphingomonas hengshuiensis]AJP71465.1 hypothetical protein TS85_06305 [Sphingomonas hengshuiensis]